MSRVPDVVRSSVDVWLAHHDRLAPGLVEGLYLVGSAALDDWQPDSDVDIVAFTADPATDDDAERLRSAHEAAAAELAVFVDGPRLAWGDVSVPPAPLHRPWTLEGEFHHDGDCFELNPITWYVLAKYGVAVRGEPASELGVATDLRARQEFVQQNVDTYWRSVGEQLATAVADAGRVELSAETLEWCALGVVRMLYTSRTGDVASKTAAAQWAVEELPGHAQVLEKATVVRGAADPAPVGRDVIERVRDLVRDVVDEIA